MKRDQESEMLKRITVQSCNDSFCPMGQVSTMVDVKKQMVSLRNEDLSELSNNLEKPGYDKAGHHCPNPKTLLLESEINLLSLNQCKES